MLDTALPKVIEPMKCRSDEHLIEEAFENQKFIAQRKLDGARYFLRKEENGEVQLQSYHISAVTGEPVVKTGHVPHLVKWAEENLPNGTILDGEIVTHLMCTSNDVTTIMGCVEDKAIQRQKETDWVKFAVIDVLYFDGISLMDKPLYYRLQKLHELYYKTWNNPEYLLWIDFIQCGKPAVNSNNWNTSAREYYHDIVKAGGEGVILKELTSTYISGARPKEWLKVKKYQTYDVVVVAFTEATKEYKGKNLENWQYYKDGVAVTKPYYYGWIGAIVFAQYDPNRDFELVEIGQTSGIDDATREHISNNKEEWLGKVIEVGAMRQNKKTGALVHPRFIRVRDDKDAVECIMGEC